MQTKNSLVTYTFLLWRSNSNKNSRATSTTDDAHLSYGCGATVASSAVGGIPGGSLPGSMQHVRDETDETRNTQRHNSFTFKVGE